MNFLTANWVWILSIVVLAWIVGRLFVRGRGHRDEGYSHGGVDPASAGPAMSSQGQSVQQQPAHKHHGCC